MITKTSLLVAAALVIAGCTSPSMSQNLNGNAPEQMNVNTAIENMNINITTGSGRLINSLDGTTYNFTSYNGDMIEEEYVLAFDSGRMATRICNQISGNYTLEGSKLNSSLMSTKMACMDEKTTELESAFNKLFVTEVQATVTSPNLILEGANGDIFLLTEK